MGHSKLYTISSKNFCLSCLPCKKDRQAKPFHKLQDRIFDVLFRDPWLTSWFLATIIHFCVNCIFPCHKSRHFKFKMAAYWCGAITPHESSRAGQFIQQEVSSYDSMRNLLIKLDAGNVYTDQIVLLFTASHSTDEIRNRHSLTQSVSKERRSWSADCDVCESSENAKCPELPRSNFTPR